MGSLEEHKYGVYAFRIGERKYSPRASIFRDKVEMITDGYGKITGFTNKELLLRFTNPEDVEETAIIEVGPSAFEGCINLSEAELREPIESIGESAFKGCRKLKRIVIPEGVYEIGASAFEDCSSLESIVLPSSLSSIGSRAFSGCTSLRIIEFRSNTIEFGAMCFANTTALMDISFPRIREISDGLLMGSGVRRVEIPDSVVRIGSSALSRCQRLQSIYFDGTIEDLRSIQFGVYWNRQMPESTKIYVRDRKGNWYNAFESPKREKKEELPARIKTAMKTLDLKGDSIPSKSEIQRAFRIKARSFHPDAISGFNLDSEYSEFASRRFRELKEASELLSALSEKK